ncbi:EAL domain-containing protein [Pseudomonas aeruginosa]|uniref:EAL domain-containing protein n=1 Tax=Pseudomonas aeruginosa TaxID=287 RepID=UPI000EB5F02F|nr:EAL domain-containing protein [Pseudomonas aeruginosa]
MDDKSMMEPVSLPIYMVYQPVARIHRDELEVVAFESLLRVKPNNRNLTTLSVITDAERAGTMPALDALITRMVCRDASQVAGMNLWLNLSQVTLSNPRAAKSIARVIEDHGLSGQVTVEITETADGQVPLLLESVRWLTSRQITVVLDDIDDGYAKSDLLRSDLIKGCKLSHRSTMRMGNDPGYQETISRLIQWCRANGKTVVIEGIETESQLAMAQRLEVDFCQGFHLWEPIPFHSLPTPGTRLRALVEAPKSSRKMSRSVSDLPSPDFAQR